MNSLIKLAVLFIWMVVVPVLAGSLPCSLLPKQKRTPGVLILTGYLLTFSVFEVLALPILLFTYGGNFRLLCVLFSVVMVILVIIGVVRCGGPSGVVTVNGLSGSDTDRQKSRIIVCVLWLIFAGILVFQLYMAFTHLTFDGDDAYYVASSVITDETGTMYRILPYTGGSTKLDVRHALALFPMWIAYLARVSGLHAANVTHSILPLLAIPLCDIAYACVAGQLFQKKIFEGKQKVLLPVFMILTAIFQIFGNVSIYTPETFLMMRSWQGKSIFVNLLIPTVIWIFLWTAVEETRFAWLLLVLVNLSAGLCSSMAVVMTLGMIILCGIFAGWAVRNRKVIKNALLVCIPGYVYVVLFVVLSIYYK